MKKKICITSECVCDLPEKILEEYGVPVIYFYIQTDQGIFKDMDEITAGNIIEYFKTGGQQISTYAPKPEEYEDFFVKILENYDEIIHIAIAKSLSKSLEYATRASEKFEGRVHVFDSGHLSTGIAHLVMKAAEMVKEGKDYEEISAVLHRLRDKVSTSFIAENADYLYRNGRVSKLVKIVCSGMKIHPVLAMKKGDMILKGIRIGSYKKSVVRYVRSELKNASKINKKRLFITHSDCTVKMIARARKAAAERCQFEEVIVSRASATISSNCGANTIGVLFVRE